MQTLTIEHDRETQNQLQKILIALLEIRDELRMQNKPLNNPEEWLNASAFCRKFDISRPTLKKRVDSGLIEKKDFGHLVFRYRWRKEPNNA